MMIIKDIIILNPVSLTLIHILKQLALLQILQLSAMPIVIITHVAGQIGRIVEQREGECFEPETSAPNREIVSLRIRLLRQVDHELHVLHQK